MASLDVAIKLHKDGQIEAAERAYREILTERPSDAGATHLLGVIRQQQGRHEESLELIGLAIAANPSQAAYYNNYGAALLSLERFRGGEASLPAFSIRPNYADALPISVRYRRLWTTTRQPKKASAVPAMSGMAPRRHDSIRQFTSTARPHQSSRRTL